MSDLADSYAALRALLPQARALTAEPDTSTVTGRHQPSSRPPWNPAAEYAVTGAEEGVRRLEASLRLAVLGHLGRRRHGSWGNTLDAIKAAEALAVTIDSHAQADAARYVDGLCRPMEELPAIDTSEPWRKVHGATCPYCRVPMLYARPRALTVTCIRWGSCTDSNGQHPIGHMEISRISADPIVRWADGLVAP